MHQVRFAAVMAAVIALTNAAQSVGAMADAKRDIPGWSDTSWGMSVAALKKLHPDMIINKDQFDRTAGVIPVEIDNQQFHAYLQFQGVGSLRKSDDTSPEPAQSEWKLGTVELWLETDDDKAVWVCENIANSLRGKYGDPTKSYDGGEVLWWVMPTTTIIKIANKGVPGSKFKPSCWIRYLPTQVSGNNKL